MNELQPPIAGTPASQKAQPPFELQSQATRSPWSLRRGRPEAAASIWNWRSEGLQSPPPDARSLRYKGMLQALVPATIGALLYFHVSSFGGSVVLGIATLIFLSALVSPAGLYAIIERGFDALAMRFARLVTWLVLRSLFYGVFVPFGKLMRRGKRDRMQRFRDSARTSYWSDRSDERAASSNRERQY